ncbi:hypothetical protein KY345_05490 [Candidatus Woesearchaeota archaeon]|nr:hypothetical protein [Candidatus Woesearchaeota archaeon]
MAEVFGVLAKKPASVTIPYVRERFEIRTFTKEESRIKKEDANLDKIVKKHNIEKTKESQDKINKLAELAAEKGYLIAMNNMILLKVLITHLEELKGETRKSAKKTNSRAIWKANHNIKEDLSLTRDYFQKAQKQLFNLLKEADSKASYGFAMKEVGFIDWRLWNYIRMRTEAKRMVKRLKIVEEYRKRVMGLLEKSEKKGLEKKEVRKLEDYLKGLVKAGKVCIENAFRLFTNLNLLVHVIIEKLEKGIKMDERLIKNYEIPAAMGHVDETTKEKILMLISNKIRTEEKAVRQEWQMTT